MSRIKAKIFRKVEFIMNDRNEPSRERILNAAFRLLSENGFANVSMRDIAKEADVATSLLTYHFLTKENLFTALATRLVSKCFDGAASAVRNGEKGDRILLICDYMERLLCEDKATMKVLLDFSAQAMWNRSFKFQFNYLFEKLSELIKNEVVLCGENEYSLPEKYSPDDLARSVLRSLYGTAFCLVISDSDDNSINAQMANFGNMLADICGQ